MTSNARHGLPWTSEIVATGYAYPLGRVNNAEYFRRCQFPITQDPDTLIGETQMESRTWCSEDENTWTLAQQAMIRLFETAPKLRDEIDVVIVASGTTMPVLHPPDKGNSGVADLAPLVLRALNRPNALGVDIKACYCTGFLRGLQLMDGLLSNPNYRAGLVLATEQGSRFSTAPTNRSTFCFIMADAAGAAVLKRGPAAGGRGLLDHVGYTDAAKFDWVGIGPDAASTIMKGSRAGTATHELLVECGKTLLERNSLRMGDIQWLLPIQTHARIVEGLRQALDCPAEKLLWFGNKTGFSGSASIPACLAEQIEKGVVKKGDLLLSLAVGAGMNCAGTLYTY